MADIQQVTQSLEPLNMGIALFAPISSVPGSPILFFSQPLISGRLFASALVLIGAELFLFIAQRFLKLESIPVIDVKNGQTLQMPLSELQGFLKWLAGGSAHEYTRTITEQDFFTVVGLEAPLTLALTVSAEYSTIPYTSAAWFLVPIFTFSGIRGALPILILELLATIFVRAVVPPESTGSKPVSEAGSNKMNNSLGLSPNDIWQLLNRFRKQGNSK